MRDDGNSAATSTGKVTMRLKRNFLTLAIAGAFALPFAAHAQSSTASLSEDDFSRLDADRDGTISRSEWRQGAARMAQQQGQQGQQPQRQAQQQGAAGQWVVVTITPVEQRIMDNQRRESLFRALDANGDGTIAAQEAGLNVQLLNAFAKLDQNNDGRIERQEFASVHVQDGSQQAQSSQGSGSASSGATAGSSGRSQ
jgi:Ca2+-binding EF-hand superfamily protein